MNAVATAAMPTSAQIVDLVQRRLERALRSRARYRYVQPRVLHEEQGFRIQSPCCSHNVDPHGGLIDIALLVPQPQGRWSLFAREPCRQQLGVAPGERVARRHAQCAVYRRPAPVLALNHLPLYPLFTPPRSR